MIASHPFFQKSEKEQGQFQIKVGLVALVVNVLLSGLLVYLGFYFLPAIFLAITISIIAPFIDVPTLVKNGGMIYYSPMFLAEKEKNGIITIHGGTLFDYYFMIDRKLNGKQRTNLIMLYCLEGMINLIEKYEKEPAHNVQVRGTSYIINERTANKIGLVKTKTNGGQQLILIFNYFNLMSSYSIAKAKLSFPNLGKTNSFQGEMVDLIDRKEYLISLKKRLQSHL